MELKTLEKTPFSEIVACFNLAFSDYLVPMAVTEAYLEKRWRGNRVDLSLSFGIFQAGKLVAFIVHGIGMWHGQKTAYYSGTGVIPAFRGRRLVEKMYSYAILKLKAAGVTQSTLEVITQNHKAVRAYQKVGFTAPRSLACFKGNLAIPAAAAKAREHYQINCKPGVDFSRLNSLAAFEFSWENQNEALALLQPDLETWEVTEAGNLMGYVVLNRSSNAILQFGFWKSKEAEAGLALLGALAQTIPAVKVNNVDRHATAIITLLQQAGLENHLDQYEMVLTI